MAHLRLSKRCLNTKPWNRSDKLYLDWFTKREAFIGKAVQTSTFLQEKIAKTAIERPDLPCIKTHEKNYSYSEINDWANQRALFFRSSSYHFQPAVIGKSWKTHPEIFPKVGVTPCDTDGYLENSSSFFEI